MYVEKNEHHNMSKMQETQILMNYAIIERYM